MQGEASVKDPTVAWCLGCFVQIHRFGSGRQNRTVGVGVRTWSLPKFAAIELRRSSCFDLRLGHREHVDAAIWLGNGILTPIEAKTLGELPRSAAPEGRHNSMYSTTATSTCTEWEEAPMHLAYERWRTALWTCVRSADALGSLIGIDWAVEDVT
ncbi:hypothetical protein PCL_11234 [Purpureocillium lilacinum]|uniref:Uncharacterized protein n=1 Tax=Purpureocillium lilacinum TaxID=33203 RepID=A0A2U3EDL2_PURLI|nr:hypothetical protein PCL_11234 [Purpureocillium lilacinum]